MFNKARFKLTAWYLLIIMFISLSFSVVIYEVQTREVDRFTRTQQIRLERRLRDENIIISPNQPINTAIPTPFSILDQELVNETKQRLILVLIVINGAIILISGGLGYLLAGKTLKPIQSMIEEQNRFIGDSSHELRTPLTALKSSMEVALLDKEFSIKDAKQLMKENISEVDKLKSLSDELLLLAQYQKRDTSIKMENIRLKELLKCSINAVFPIAKKKKITINNEVKNTKVKGNKDSLIKLFVIILDNAIKYSPEKSTITINNKRIDGQVYINIKDQGIGINKEDLSNIFDRFYRADTARSKVDEGGFGLGLSIAKKIAEINHGKISVSSTSGRGSIFTVKLPY